MKSLGKTIKKFNEMINNINNDNLFYKELQTLDAKDKTNNTRIMERPISDGTKGFPEKSVKVC